MSAHDVSEKQSVDKDVPVTTQPAAPRGPVPDDYVYPTGLKFAVILSFIYTSIFLVVLDKIIISTAVPTITNEFNAADDVGWYGSAYLLTNAAFVLVFGKLYQVTNIKYTFMCSILIFEVGSAICGAAPNSIAFIIGRAIAGLGAGGCQSGAISLIVYAVPLAKRPKYQGLVGAVLGIASVVGPILGGVFTSHVTWRWCFYLNLPIGAVILALVAFFLHLPARKEQQKSFLQVISHLNIEGLFAMVPGIICLTIALQWGGFSYSWNDGRIIALLTLACALLVSFVLLQFWRPERALVPPRIMKQRSVASAVFISACTGAHQILILFYLPIYFQSVQGTSAARSGVLLIPQLAALVAASVIMGILTSKIGYYTPVLIFGVCVSSIGLGLLNTLQVDSTLAQLVGYQILYGFGLGASIQAPNLAVQTVLPRVDVPVGVSLVIFAQTLSGSIFVSIGQNVFDSNLAKGLRGIVNVTPEDIEKAGVTGLIDSIPAKYHAAVLEAYNTASRIPFRVALILGCLSILGAATMEWRSVKKGGSQSQGAAAEKPIERKASAVSEEC